MGQTHLVKLEGGSQKSPLFQPPTRNTQTESKDQTTQVVVLPDPQSPHLQKESQFTGLCENSEVTVPKMEEGSLLKSCLEMGPQEWTLPHGRVQNCLTGNCPTAVGITHMSLTGTVLSWDVARVPTAA